MNKDKAYLYQISEMLIKEYKYQRMFAPDEKGIWLVNVHRDQFPLIYLVNEKVEVTQKEEFVFESLRKQMEQISSRPIRLSVWNLATREQKYNSMMVDELHISENHIPLEISEEFPEVVRAFHVEGSIEATVSRIEKKYFAKPKKELKQRVSRAKRKGIPLSIVVILAICVVMFIAVNLLGRYIGDMNNAAIILGALYQTPMIAAHEYWRVFTSGFLHVAPLHLLMNCLALVSLARLSLLLYSEKKMLGILLSSIVMGGVACFIFGDNGITLGISGGLYGLMGACFIGLLLKGAMKNPSVRNSFIQTLILNLFITFMPGLNIAWLGHLGGLITGLYLGFMFSYSKPKTVMRRNFIIGACVLCIALGYRVATTKDVDTLYPGNDIEVVRVLKNSPFSFYGDYLEEKLVEFYNGR